MFWETLTLSLLFYCASGISVHFQDCGDVGSYMVDEVYLDVPCKSQPCWLPLKRQTNTTVSFKSTNTVATDLIPDAYLMMANSKLKIDHTPGKCPQSVCPINPGEKKSHSIQLKPQYNSQPIKVDVFLEMYNQAHKKLFCVLFPAVIYNPETHTPSTMYKVPVVANLRLRGDLRN